MKNQWELWSEGVDRGYCNHIIDVCKELPAETSKVGFDGAEADSSYRSSSIRWLDVKGTHKNIADLLMHFINSSNRTNFGFDITSMNEIQFTEYVGTENGKYDWHHDVFWENPDPYDRKLSIVLQLTDPSEYEGGKFEFFGCPNPDENFRKKGSVLIFPSFFMHRVLPVTSGTRYSLVSWIEGPKFR